MKKQKIVGVSLPDNGKYLLGGGVAVLDTVRKIDAFQITYHNGQMALVPWIQCLDADGDVIVEINEAQVEGVFYSKENENKEGL